MIANCTFFFPRQASGDMSVYWDWLELNQSTHVATSRENRYILTLGLKDA